MKTREMFYFLILHFLFLSLKATSWQKQTNKPEPLQKQQTENTTCTFKSSSFMFFILPKRWTVPFDFITNSLIKIPDVCPHQSIGLFLSY